ncbi:MAG: ORF6N domain-containing protein [Thermoguttaceae bacterium]
MSQLLSLSIVEEKIRVIRNQEVILDSDLAVLYGVKTMRINEAVKNNPGKFPAGYVFELTPDEKREVIEIFDNQNLATQAKFSPVLPKAFTEKGAYMLATILKGETATATTIAIVEAFADLRRLSKTVAELSKTQDKAKQKSLMQKGGDIFIDLVGENFLESESETTFEINLAVMALKHTVKRTKKK